jgi:hypothetical protein
VSPGGWQEEAAFNAKFQREMGVAAREQRVEDYIRRHTAGGVTMLDPTGRAPVEPSAVALFATRHFGLGGSGDRQIGLVQARAKNVCWGTEQRHSCCNHCRACRRRGCPSTAV